jgi:hypothetical protein
MRDLTTLDSWRVREAWVWRLYGFYGDATCGVFNIPWNARLYRCVASNGAGWDHVSISLPDRCPGWEAMDWLKRRFFEDDELALEFHLPPGKHISIHPYCLHLWRPHGVTIPLPPEYMV